LLAAKLVVKATRFVLKLCLHQLPIIKTDVSKDHRGENGKETVKEQRWRKSEKL